MNNSSAAFGGDAPSLWDLRLCVCVIDGAAYLYICIYIYLYLYLHSYIVA